MPRTAASIITINKCLNKGRTITTKLKNYFLLEGVIQQIIFKKKTTLEEPVTYLTGCYGRYKVQPKVEAARGGVMADILSRSTRTSPVDMVRFVFLFWIGNSDHLTL